MSIFTRNIVAMQRAGAMDPLEAARQIFYIAEDPEAARAYLVSLYESESDSGSPDAERYFDAVCDLYIKCGRLFEARHLIRSGLAEGKPLHVSNLVFLEAPRIRAIVDDDRGLLYIPIPKCGCTTVKNFITSAKHGKTFGRGVHYKYPELYRTIETDRLATDYADYFKFTVVRDPVDRLTSYYMKNVREGSLKTEAADAERVYGLSTAPTPDHFASRYLQYRQVFRDFRHHTNPMAVYLGGLPLDALDRIFRIDEIAEFRDRIERTYGTSVSDDRFMVSTRDDALKRQCARSFHPLKKVHQADYDLFEDRLDGKPDRLGASAVPGAGHR